MDYRQQSGSPEVALRNENGSKQETKFPDINQRKDTSPKSIKKKNVQNPRYKTVKLMKSSSIINMKQADSTQNLGR